MTASPNVFQLRQYQSPRRQSPAMTAEVPQLLSVAQGTPVSVCLNAESWNDYTVGADGNCGGGQDR